ncbi:MAG TPA: hypothetical protein DCS97_11525 [Planctomycetes bacterium]|nr:hypothetical protein [Planctomycetota bacterium]
MSTKKPHLVTISTLLVLAALGSAWAAEDPAGDIGKTPAPPPPAAEAEEGEAPADNAQSRIAKGKATGLVREGMDLVRRFNEDKTRNATAIVDAAICFTSARKFADTTGDTDLIGEIQANLFWCKKQMDLPALQDYVARKGDEATHALKAMDAVAAVKVDASEAASYFARAEKFAGSNAEDHLQIAIRFLEVAERFPGATQGTEANKRALAAQQALMKKAAEAAVAARQTRFTKPVKLVPGATAVPAAQAQKEALALVKKSYQKGYAKKDVPAKRRLARKLLEESAKNKSDVAVYHQMLSESIRLAGESEDYEPLLDGIDRLASSYTGVDALQEKKAALKKMTGKATATSILKLLETPEDPAANLAAGKWFCFSARRWNDGLRMLVLGSDEALAKVAQMELDKPANPDEKLLIADAWYELGKKATAKDEKTGIMGRAMLWYQQVAKKLEGIAKEKVDKRLVEIDKLLPLDLDNVDWGNLTASQWDKLKGKMVAVQARVDRFDPGFSLAAGERVRIVAHPTDQWTVTGGFYSGKGTFGWKGRSEEFYYYSAREAAPGALMVWVENGDKSNCGIISGPGRVFFSPNITWYSDGDRSGQIRVKVLAVDDEE